MRPPAARFSPSRFHRRGRGFSFTEILFAVMILGIGFIMVVAIFPVALQQTQSSQDETVGAAVVQAGVNYVIQNSSTTFVTQTNVAFAGGTLINFPILRPTFTGIDDYNLYKAALTGMPTPLTTLAPSTSELVGEVWSFDSIAGTDLAAYINDPTHVRRLAPPQPWPNVVWPMMAQNMIHAADPKYAWVAFYRRNLLQTTVSAPFLYSYAPSAQLIVIALKSQVKQFYEQSDLTLSTTGYPTSVQPSLGRAAINAPNANNLNYTIQFVDPVLQSRAGEGAFVVIATDRLSPGAPNAGLLNGHIYKLGTLVSGTTDTWEFAPGYGPPIAPVGNPLPLEDQFINPGRTFVVYMVGKALDPNDTTGKSYTGLTQDIAAYSTFISCPNN